MHVYTVTIAPEANEPILYPVAFKTIDAARNLIKTRYNNPKQRNEFTYRSEYYTYFYINRLEVEE